MAEAETTDWGAWSKDAVRLMQERNAAWQQRFALPDGSPFLWDIKTATIQFRRNTDQVVASVCVVGTTSKREGTFLWAWANESIPAFARKRLEQVHDFGTRHELELLATPEFPGSRAEALEMLAVAGRVLDAEGVFIHSVGELTYFFALSDFRIGH
jgi:hypothetical protein